MRELFLHTNKAQPMHFEMEDMVPMGLEDIASVFPVAGPGIPGVVFMVMVGETALRGNNYLGPFRGDSKSSDPFLKEFMQEIQ